MGGWQVEQGGASVLNQKERHEEQQSLKVSRAD